VSSYSIFLEAARSLLFAYVELESVERWNALSTTEVCQRWWRFMRDLMETHADNRPVSEDLVEVFHLSA
jgi:L-rhamnose mutarotase